MNLAIFVGLNIENKLRSKIIPLASLDEVENIFIFRREPLAKTIGKATCFSSPGYLSKIKPLCEIHRIFSFLNVCRKNKIDYVIGIYFLPHLLLAWLAAVLCNKKLISVVIENPALYKKNVLFKAIIKRSTAVIVRGTNSEAVMWELGCPSEKIFKPQNLYSFGAAPAGKEVQKEYDLVLIGNFDIDKRIDVFIEALYRLKEKLPNFKAIIIGRGYLEKKLRSLIQRRRLESQVELLNFQDDISQYLRRAKVLALTSQTEGLPMVLLEAMGYGLPCVASSVGDVTDAAKDNYNSLLVEPNKVEAFADTFYRILTDEALYRRLSENALKIREEKQSEYSLEYIKNIWKEILSR